MKNKKGDYKYGIILSLILGLMVLGLSFYFIFHELWTGEDSERQICRQSIQARALLPEHKFAGVRNPLVSLKAEYPLRCKTYIVEVDEGDIRDKSAGEKIAEAIVECWALYDKGDSSAFPSDIYGSHSICVPCARIHLTDDARTYMEKNSDVEINIREALDGKMRDDYTYWMYLRDAGKKFSAFDFASSREFDFGGVEFDIKEEKKSAVFKNKLTGGVDEQIPFGMDFLSFVKLNNLYLPKTFDYTKGDLLINYGIVTTSRETKIGDYIPYLFYFQAGQKNPEPFKEVQDVFVDSVNSFRNVKFCEAWEGIPA